MHPLAQIVLSPFMKDGKISVPEWCKRVKLDVGLSLNAPHSEMWLADDDQLCVFGFEPNPTNVAYLKRDLNAKELPWPVHLNPTRIGTSFFLVEAALGSDLPGRSTFYCTKSDPGTSSLYKPVQFELTQIVDVPVIPLTEFFDVFPWNQVPFIDQLKVDAQSADFDVVKGCGSYLADRIVYLDVEITTNNQYHKQDSPEEFDAYIRSQGFTRLHQDIQINSSYINERLRHLVTEVKYQGAIC